VNGAWLIRGAKLETPARSGGVWAETGFELQRAYAVLKAVELATCEDGIVALRYEGAQDIDLGYADGRQVHVQLKSRASGRLDWTFLKPVLLGFLNDWLDAAEQLGEAPPLSFRLVTTAPPVGSRVARLMSGSGYRLAKTLATSAPVRLKKRHGAMALETGARAVLEATSVELMGASALSNLTLMLHGRLARFGVPGTDFKRTHGELLAQLRARANLRPANVIEVLAGHGLTPYHPAVAGSSLKLVRVGGAVGEATETIFREGRSTWEAIEAHCDIPRTQSATLEADLLGVRRAELRVLTGPGGSGKSTLARRIAHDLQARGKVMATELASETTTPENWNALLQLAAALERPALVILDDVSPSAAAPDQVAAFGDQHTIILLATTRPDSDTHTALRAAGVASRDVEMAEISDEEAAALAARMGRPLPSDLELRQLKQSRQIFLLAMVMQEGASEAFARKLGEPLKREAPELAEAYFDLCVCARNDQAVPESLLLRRHPAALDLDKRPKTRGLISRQGREGDLLRGSHALLAEGVVKAFNINPAVRGVDLLRSADPQSERERRFAVRLAQTLVTEPDLNAARAIAAEFEAALLTIVGHAEYSDLRRIADILLALGRPAVADQVSARADATPLVTGVDAMMFMQAAESNGDFQAGVDRLLTFYGENDTSYGRRNFIARATHNTRADQIERLVSQTLTWLRRHHFPTDVAKSLLNVVTIRSEADAPGQRTALIELLARSAPDTRLLLAASTLAFDRFPDSSFAAALRQYAEAFLTPHIVAIHPQVGTTYARALSKAQVAEGLDWAVTLLLETAARSDVPSYEQGQLLKTAVMAAPAVTIDEVRRRAIALVQAEETKTALRFIRQDFALALTGSVSEPEQRHDATAANNGTTR